MARPYQGDPEELDAIGRIDDQPVGDGARSGGRSCDDGIEPRDAAGADAQIAAYHAAILDGPTLQYPPPPRPSLGKHGLLVCLEDPDGHHREKFTIEQAAELLEISIAAMQGAMERGGTIQGLTFAWADRMPATPTTVRSTAASTPRAVNISTDQEIDMTTMNEPATTYADDATGEPKTEPSTQPTAATATRRRRDRREVVDAESGENFGGYLEAAQRLGAHFSSVTMAIRKGTRCKGRLLKWDGSQGVVAAQPTTRKKLQPRAKVTAAAHQKPAMDVKQALGLNAVEITELINALLRGSPAAANVGPMEMAMVIAWAKRVREQALMLHRALSGTAKLRADGNVIELKIEQIAREGDEGAAALQPDTFRFTADGAPIEWRTAADAPAAVHPIVARGEQLDIGASGYTHDEMHSEPLER